MHPTRQLEVAILSVIGVVVLAPLVFGAYCLWMVASLHEVHTTERRVSSPDGAYEILLRDVAAGGFGPSEFATHVFVLPAGSPPPDDTAGAVVSLADASVDDAFTARVRWLGNDVVEVRVDGADTVLRYTKQLRMERRVFEVILILGASGICEWVPAFSGTTVGGGRARRSLTGRTS